MIAITLSALLNVGSGYAEDVHCRDTYLKNWRECLPNGVCTVYRKVTYSTLTHVCRVL